MHIPFLDSPVHRALLPLILILVATGIVIIIRFAIRQVVDARLPYQLEKSLFTPAERQFLGVLKGTLPAGVECYGKVRLIDIFRPKSHLTGPDRLKAVNRVASKHVDFLLVRSSDTKPLLAIELDDKSHQAANRQARDIFLNQLFADTGLPLLRILEDTGLPLLRILVQRSYNVSTVREMVVAAMPPGDFL